VALKLDEKSMALKKPDRIVLACFIISTMWSTLCGYIIGTAEKNRYLDPNSSHQKVFLV
jgi:hypothetical protein